MWKNTMTKILVALMIVAVMGFGNYVFAGRGMGRGSGSGMMGQQGYGQCPYGTGAYGGNLSDEDIKKLDAERKAFWDATVDLRQSLYAKELALKSELIKKETDIQNALNLQKEISALEAQFDQKRIEHLINMKKINPNAGMGRGMGKGFRCGKRGGMGCGGCPLTR